MDDIPDPSRLVAWVRAIGVLTASADHQAVWLDSLGPVASWNVSELGLEFDDGYVLMDQWVEAGWIARTAVPSIAALNDLLDRMSGESNAAIWTRQALVHHQAWREVRDLSIVVLSAFS